LRKIGILTFHRAYNYGAILQAYALQQTIATNGFEPEIVDYRTPQIEEWFHAQTLKAKLINIALFFLFHGYYAARKRKEAKFISFSKDKLHISPQYMNAEDMKNLYDAVVVGSDQVWNLQMTRLDYTYFLPYKDGASKLSYAASFGSNSIPKENRELIKEYLNNFQTLFVREEDGIAIINELVGKPAQKVMDPTFLVKREDWLSICKFSNHKHKYILLYLVADQTFAINVAKGLAKKYGFDVLCVNPPCKPLDNITSLMDVGPEEFLGLISNAECVVTTSYHGLILSMNLNTPFLFELNTSAQNTNSRINEILYEYHLEQYLIDSNSIDEYVHLHYNWNYINEHIEENRAHSIAKLNESLNLVIEK
jgi:hypothetical protein